MRVVRTEDAKQVGAERKRVRVGSLQNVWLGRGTPGTAGNYFFTAATTQSDYHTPRHRHNFEQIRVQVRGEFDYERDVKMTPGMVGYFPEGCFYGPSHSGDNSMFLLLQFGGASANGYMSQEEYAEAMARLTPRGEFHDGIFTWHDEAGKKHNKDGYEAVWEESRQCELKYPKPRYERPVFMRPEHFEWRASPDEPGVAYKALGTFSERDVRIGHVRIEAGITARRLPSDTLYFVLKGKGRAGAEHWLAESSLYIERNESAEVRAEETAELFYVTLPNLDGLSVPTHHRLEAVT